MVDLSRATEFVAELVGIESINPSLVPGGSGEGRIARHVLRIMAACGAKTQLQEVGRERFNAIGVLKGQGSGRTLVLNGHLDTVGIAGMEEPFSGAVEQGRLYGRGAQDMKGGLAAALLALRELAAASPPLPGDLIVAAVADEEFESTGARAFLESGVVADAAIVLEPTGLEIATAHKGFAWAEIATRGRAAHGSRPEEGRDAIFFMGRVLGELEKLQASLGEANPHPLLGRGSVHASLISGGQELSSYPAECRLSLERRLVPPEGPATLDRELTQIISRLSQDPDFHAQYKLGYGAQWLETGRESRLAQTLLACAERVVGSRAKFGVQAFWTDAALFSESGIPSVLFGPGGAGMHSYTEYVNLEDVVLCAETLVHCARAFCST